MRAAKICSVLVTLALLLAFSGCDKNEELIRPETYPTYIELGARNADDYVDDSGYWIPETHRVYREPSDKRYADLLDSYRSLIIDYNENPDRYEYNIPSDSIVSLSDSMHRSNSFGYVIRDLNNNGTPELIFFANENIDAIYTLVDGKPNLLEVFEDHSFCLIDKNGNICKDISLHPGHTTFVYKISANGKTKEFISKLDIEDMLADVGARYFKVDSKGNRTVITEAEYNKLNAEQKADITHWDTITDPECPSFDALAWAGTDYVNLFEADDDDWKPVEKASYKKPADAAYASTIETFRADVIWFNSDAKKDAKAKRERINSKNFDYKAIAAYTEFGYVIRDIDGNGSNELIIVYNNQMGEIYSLNEYSPSFNDLYGNGSIDSEGRLHQKVAYDEESYTEIRSLTKGIELTVGFEFYDDVGNMLKTPRYYITDEINNKKILSYNEYKDKLKIAETPNPSSFYVKAWAGKDYVDLFE
ncbi:MAG: hypothetical protein LBS74_05415 [Oscillospiraceae bacterium]|jgi:hypothetical protein|nr:hypothetical protein [Oscillospiraceae bacterium]